MKLIPRIALQILLILAALMVFAWATSMLAKG